MDSEFFLLYVKTRLSDWTIRVTHEFNISIMDFVKDIKDSTIRPNGYLDMLKKTPHLQDRYETAINHIYGEWRY